MNSNIFPEFLLSLTPFAEWQWVKWWRCRPS